MISIFAGFVLAMNADAKPFDCGDGTLLDRISVMEQKLYDEELSIEYIDSDGKTWWIDNSEKIYAAAFDQCLHRVFDEADLGALTSAEYHALLKSLYGVGYMSWIDTSNYMSQVIDTLDLPNVQQYSEWRDRVAIRHWNPNVSLDDPDLYELVSAMAAAQGDRVGVNLSDFNRIVSIERPTNGIVVISHPGCAPSRRFYDWLRSTDDSEMSASISENFTVLYTQNGDLRLNSLSSWQASLPVDAFMVRSTLEWPEIVDWATPTFYFYKDGEVVRQIAGWPHDGREQELREAMVEFGFLEE